jgi:hypothetical protein
VADRFEAIINEILKIKCNEYRNSLNWYYHYLTPKGGSVVFGPFLKFGQAIVDAIFVPKFSIFR